jgi:hypothetical protein
MHGHVQKPGEISQWAAHAEGKSGNAHMLDRGVGEHAFDVAPAVEHEGGKQERQEAHADQQRPGGER